MFLEQVLGGVKNKEKTTPSVQLNLFALLKYLHLIQFIWVMIILNFTGVQAITNLVSSYRLLRAVLRTHALMRLECDLISEATGSVFSLKKQDELRSIEASMCKTMSTISISCTCHHKIVCDVYILLYFSYCGDIQLCTQSSCWGCINASKNMNMMRGQPCFIFSQWSLTEYQLQIPLLPKKHFSHRPPLQ